MDTSANMTHSLTIFQRDVLVAIERLDNESTKYDLVHGGAIQDELSDAYDKRIENARVYQNLDRLVESELVERVEIDNRTNGYPLTEAGRGVLVGEAEWVVSALE